MTIDTDKAYPQAEAARRGSLNDMASLLRDLIDELKDLSDTELGILDGATITTDELNTLDNPILATEAGAGITGGTGTIYKSSVRKIGGIIYTRILVDLTGLRSTAADDIIGVDGTSEDCHIGQITTARNGTILTGRVTCLEAPTGGDPDIDLYAADESTGSEDDAISGLTETQLVNSGDHTLGSVKVLDAFPTDEQYLYLVAGATTDADYTAGKLLIELEGYEA